MGDGGEPARTLGQRAAAQCGHALLVTTVSMSLRAAVTGRSPRLATMRECRPSGVVEGNATMERPPGDAAPPRMKST